MKCNSLVNRFVCAIAGCLLFASQCISQSLTTSSNLLARTVSWHLHWENKMGFVPPGLQNMVTVKVREGTADMLVTGFNWSITYGFNEDQLYPIQFARLADFPEELRNRTISTFASANALALQLPNYQSDFKRLSAYSPALRGKLLACFEAEACSVESLSYYKDENNKLLHHPRLWIAPVSDQFPVILYFVENVPYIGKVYFNTSTFKPVYADFSYISDDSKWRGSCLKLMKAVRSEGDLFEFSGGHLIAVSH